MGAPSTPKGLGSTAQHVTTVTPGQPVALGGCWFFNRVPKDNGWKLQVCVWGGTAVIVVQETHG